MTVFRAIHKPDWSWPTGLAPLLHKIMFCLGLCYVKGGAILGHNKHFHSMKTKCQVPSSSSSWGATTSEKFWPSQRVSSIWSSFWCSPSSLLSSSLLYRSLHHPPIYLQVFLAILLVRVTTHILFVTMLLPGIRCACPNQANLCALM